MKVLLVKEVPNVGQAGETKNVADGFAQNTCCREAWPPWQRRAP